MLICDRWFIGTVKYGRGLLLEQLLSPCHMHSCRKPYMLCSTWLNRPFVRWLILFHSILDRRRLGHPGPSHAHPRSPQGTNYQKTKTLSQKPYLPRECQSISNHITWFLQKISSSRRLENLQPLTWSPFLSFDFFFTFPFTDFHDRESLYHRTRFTSLSRCLKLHSNWFPPRNANFDFCPLDMKMSTSYSSTIAKSPAAGPR